VPSIVSIILFSSIHRRYGKFVYVAIRRTFKCYLNEVIAHMAYGGHIGRAQHRSRHEDIYSKPPYWFYRTPNLRGLKVGIVTSLYEE